MTDQTLALRNRFQDVVSDDFELRRITLQNIPVRPGVGLIFFVPGKAET